MMRFKLYPISALTFVGAALAISSPAFANANAVNLALPGESESLVRTALLLGLMAFLPALVISMTSFVRIVIVLSMIRHALGMPETPPNTVLVSLALFMTAASMGPTLQQSTDAGLGPFLDGSKPIATAMADGSAPLKAFMLKQVRDSDLKTVYEIAKKPLPKNEEEVELMQLVPAFMLNELRTAFTIGFVILLPFLLIDLVVSAILLSLGMLMVPPATISLPLKILMFVLIDGWGLILEGVMGSFR
ncbi:flagellar type III secretion system pore protein FliP [Sphingorhabdus arenilitoris]|uniref:Flagellar biosynthetic protein FliP n=1 Tax=Sphingorhabdus arenilitoris TaxID=1490041 RepID=A0ABV8RCE2_9SPHN